jgi:CRP-like cAMP-binding protein
MRDLLLAATYLVIAITLLSRSGVNLAGIVVTSAVITGVVGISLQDTLGNLVGGIVLQMGHVIRVGDWVRIDGEEGQVKEISWWQTSIETRAWDTIVIPNRVLTKGHVTLLGQRVGAPQQHRQSISFNVDFRYAPTDVIDAVEKALRAEPLPNVAREPAPFCLVMDFKDSYLSYAVWYWLTDLLRPGVVDSLVRSRIYFALRRANIPLSIPARSLFITQEDEMRRERKQSEELERRIAALQSIDLFHTLTDDEQRELADRLHVAPFGRGEAMIRQGAQGHSLYLITSGEAEVRVTAEDAAVSKTVATLHAGDFFGEMGLMTGEPRSATVVATTNVECYRLDQEAFMDILRRRPQIAEDISHMLAHRRHELDAAREGLNEETMRLHMRGTEHDLLHRIRRFFALDGHNSAHS